ncbi:cytochrome P450 monooxygenase [Mycena galericulata]|nr:cytochrome P450 monooxygenase [Mycena galericulata]
MHFLLRLILPVAGTAVAYVLLQLTEILYREFSHPLRRLPAPSNPSFIFGNFEELEEDPRLTRKWRYQLGPMFLFKGVFNTRELYAGDTTAIDHILKNNAVYNKRIAINANSRLVGEGLLGVEGEDHKRQRRVMNPAFGSGQIKSLTSFFLDKSLELRDIWTRQVVSDSEATRVEVLSWLSKMTLDVIGLSGFGYQFDSLDPDGPPSKIHEAFARIMDSPSAARQGILRHAQLDLPLLRLLPLSSSKAFKDGRKQLFTLGNKLLKESKAAGDGSKSGSSGRDLFSLLLRANMAADIPEHHRMSDAEVVGQIPTFLIAGHATSSSAVSWALHSLSINQRVQTKLREELFTLATESPTLEQLDSLPYLDSVIRETLRVHAPVSYVTRIAAVDDVMPLATPCVDSKGRSHSALTIPKGQIIRVPIADVNTDTSLWGEDAAEFKPQRWSALPDSVHNIPTVWGNMLTFLAGPHSCIGFRFSLAEQKALLFVLIRGFEFTPALPEDDFRKSSGALQSPFVRSEIEEGAQMPLLVRTYQR